MEWLGHAQAFVSGSNPGEEQLNKPFTQDFYLMQDPNNAFPSSAVGGTFPEIFYLGTPPETERIKANLLYLTPWYKTFGDRMETFFLGDKQNNILTISGNRITYGLGPVHWFCSFENENSFLRLKTNTSYGYGWDSYVNAEQKVFFPFVLNQLQDASPLSDLGFTVYDENGNFVSSGKFVDFIFLGVKDGFFDKYSQIPLPSAGKYTLQVIDSSYTIQNRKGKMTVTAVANTQTTDKNPPSMKSFNILTNGEFTDLVSVEQASKIQFSVQDKESSIITTLFYKELDQSIWKEINVSYQEGLYYAEINSQFPKGYISLKLNVRDTGGNKLEYIAEPAFYNSDQSLKPIQATLSEPLNESRGNSISLKLKWLPVNAAEKYHFQLSDDSLFTNIVSNDPLLISTEKSVNYLKNDTEYFWRVSAINMYGEGEWSAVWKFRTKLMLPNKITILFPEDKYTLTTDSLQFQWYKSSPQVSKYWFIISTDSLYKKAMVDTTLTDTVKFYKNFSVGFNYWWKVKAKNESGWGTFSDSRKIFFNPVDVDESEELPTVYSLSQNYPNPFNPTTTIEYTIPNVKTLHATSLQHVTLKIYDLLGREIATLVNKEQLPGRYSVEFVTESTALPSGISAKGGYASGVYFYRIQVGSSANSGELYTEVRKMILLK